MKILLYYPFTDAQAAALRDLAARHGGHELLVAADEEEAVRLVPGCQVLLGHFPERVVGAGRRLRWIQSFSAGMDNFLFPALVERDEVQVSNAAGLYATQGAEHAWALLLALSRGLRPAIDHMRLRRWQGDGAVVLTGMTLGIIGLGGFGQETARRSQGYDMRVIGLDPVRRLPVPNVDEVRAPDPDNLRWLLGQADAVVITCPLTPQTHRLIGGEQLRWMKDSAFLVCVSRGGIVDETALAVALTAGQIAGAGLDVCEVEPLPAESPLWETPNLILTPHRAGASQHRPRELFEFMAHNLERYLQGETPRNLVDKHRGF